MKYRNTSKNERRNSLVYKKKSIKKILVVQRVIFSCLTKIELKLLKLSTTVRTSHVSNSHPFNFYSYFVAEFQKLINELNRMPMTFLTQKMRKRQKEIEQELNKLEDSIRIFSRTKVYVKLND